MSDDVIVTRPWEKDSKQHPRWAEYLELERHANELRGAMQEAFASYFEAFDQTVEVQHLIYGDPKRTVWECDSCDFALPKRRLKNVGDWRVWTVDDDSGDTLCRCPECVVLAERGAT